MRPLDRLKNKVRKENLWLYILRLLVRKQMYGHEIRAAVNDNFGFWVGNVTSYKVLYNLESGAYVRSSLKEGRVYYKITPSGRRELKAAERFLREA